MGQKSKKITRDQFEHAQKMAMSKTDDVLPKKILRWIDNDVLKYSRYFFTYRKGKARHGYCTHCHRDVALELGRTYTEQDVLNIRRRHKEKGFCPDCHSSVEFRDANRGRSYMVDKEFIIFATPLPDGGVLVRAGLVFRDYAPDYRCVETVFCEEYRIYYNTDVDLAWRREWGIDRSRKTYIKKWKVMTTIPSPSSKQPYTTSEENYAFNHFYGFTDTVFRKTNLKYSQISAYMENDDDPCSYLDTYIKYPVLTEKLIKEGFVELVKNIPYANVAINRRKKTVASALGLTKGDIRELKDKSVDEVLTMQAARKKDITYTQARWIGIYEIKAKLPEIEKHLPAKKAIKYLEKQGERTYTLLDYWRDCEQLNLDLDREEILLPENLKKAHQRTIDAVKEMRKQEKLEKMRKDEMSFAQLITKYKKRYCFRHGGLLIRPAYSAAELISEGSALHHCVAGYAHKHLTGKTVILFIRKSDAPDTPFYTLEYDPENEQVVQCRGLQNCGRTPEIKQFEVEFLKYLKANKSKPKKAQVA